jgi:ABC-type Fe3+/spermidine/putrescine transport system ATPase subunit
MVFVTHDQHEALSLSDRIAVMRDGALQQIDSPQQLYERPTTEFVRDFLGKAVLLKGMNNGSNEGEAQVTLDGAPSTVLHARSTLPCGKRCVVALRPEDIIIRPRSNAAPPAQAVLAGFVIDVRFTGRRIEYRR